MKTDCGQVSYLQQKHWCPRQLNPIFWQWSCNNFSFSEIFLLYLVLWKLMSECLNRQFVICTSERDIYWDSSLCIIRIQSVLYPSYIQEPNSSTYPFLEHMLYWLLEQFLEWELHAKPREENRQDIIYWSQTYLSSPSVSFNWGTYKVWINQFWLKCQKFKIFVRVFHNAFLEYEDHQCR